MGRRRSNAPRRGSLAYLPRKRASRPIGRIHHWPDVTLDSPRLLGFSGYKVGMSYVYLINNVQGSPTFGQEVICPVTIVETPPAFVAGFRGYTKSVDGLKALSEVWVKDFPKNAERVILKPQTRPNSPDVVKKLLSRIAELRAVFLTQPHLANVPQKKPEVFEVKVIGGSIEDQFNYLNELLGKTINISDVFAEGQYIDVIAITKGKGIQGPVKRWGVKKRHHKSRKTVRGVATLGPWTPHYVMYTVPRAGQMGFHQRTERNKRILKINLNGEDVNPRGGFPHYGVIRSSNILLSGSTPGPAKRILKFRFAEKAPSRATVKPPQITYSSIKSK